MSDGEAFPPADKNDSFRSYNLRGPVGDLAILASGLGNGTAWHYQARGRGNRMDAAGRRALRWKEAVEVMLKPWFTVKNGNNMGIKRNISEWLRTKLATLSQALNTGKILPIDVLDAVVSGSPEPRQAVP